MFASIIPLFFIHKVGSGAVESIPLLIHLLLRTVFHKILVWDRDRGEWGQNLESHQENQRHRTARPWLRVISRYIGNKPIGSSLCLNYCPKPM